MADMDPTTAPKPDANTETKVDAVALAKQLAEKDGMLALLQKQVADLTGADAKRKADADAAAAAAKLAEKDAAAKGGQVDKLLEMERAAAAELKAKLDAASPAAANAAIYESIIKGQIAAALASIPEAHRPALDGVPLTAQLSLVQSIAALAAKAAAPTAKPPATGSAPPPAQTVDLDSMPSADRSKYLAGLTRDQRAELLSKRLGVEGPSTPPFMRH